MKHVRIGAAIVMAAMMLVILSGCFYINLGDGHTVVGNGKLESRDIDLGYAVTGLTNQTSIDVVIDTELEGKAVLEAESNLIDYIDVSQQSDGTVTVDMEPNTSITVIRPITLRVPAVEGGRIEVNGSGNITQTGGTLTGDSFDIRIAGSGDISLDLQTQSLSIAIDGSGDIDLKAVADETTVRSNGSGEIVVSGQTQKLDVSLNGSGAFEGFDFPVQDAHVVIGGSGDASVFVTGSLTGNIGGSGDITYDGDPASVSVSDGGSGDVRPR